MTANPAHTFIHRVGEPIEFEGYADDFENSVAGVQFSLDDGVSWTTYPTEGVRSDRGVRWTFAYTPQVPGRYLLKARAVDGRGVPASVVSGFAFEALEPLGVGGAYGDVAVRPVGPADLREGKIFRSRALTDITATEATFLVNGLGVRSIYDIRNQQEVARRPEPYLTGIKMVAVEPATESRASNSGRRLAAGVIGEYGAPEERMCANYRRYVREYPMIGMVLRSMAAEGVPSLVHCKNGKDRTGVLCAVLLRLAGFSDEAIMEDYLLTNAVNAQRTEAEFAAMSAGMTPYEEQILRSFLEARPAYLHAFFDEVDRVYGSFAAYVSDGLRLTPVQCESLRALVGEPR